MLIDDLATTDSQYNPALFSSRGRIGRLRFFVTEMLLYIVMVFVSAFGRAAGSGIILMAASVVVIAMMVLYIFTMIKRLHDLKRPGVLWLLILVPVLNILFFIYLCLAKSAWPEQDGPDIDGIRIEDIISK